MIWGAVNKFTLRGLHVRKGSSMSRESIYPEKNKGSIKAYHQDISECFTTPKIETNWFKNILADCEKSLG